jgi:hypothetical protein
MLQKKGGVIININSNQKNFLKKTLLLLLISFNMFSLRRWRCWCLNSKDKGTTTKKEKKEGNICSKNKK